MAKKYVPDGAYLICNKGVGFCQLKVTNHKNVSIYGKKSATEGDKVPNVNVSCMGICSVTRSACQPVPTLWSGVQQGVTIGPYRKLLENSTLGCALGGKISIHFSLPMAMLALDKNTKDLGKSEMKRMGAKVDDWFQKQFDDQEKRNNLMPLGKLENFKLGIVEGVYGGVKGIGEGLVFLKDVQDKIYDAGVNAITHPVETAGKIKDGAVSTGKAVKGGVDWVTNTDNLKKAASDFGQAHVDAYNWLSNPENVKKAAHSALENTKEGLVKAKDWAAKQSPRDWGKYGGRGTFEVALFAVGVGEAKAVVSGAEVANVAAKAGEGANVLAKAGETVNLTEKIAEGGNVLDKASGGKTLGEVVSASAKEAMAMQKGESLGNFGERVIKEKLKKDGYDTFYEVQNKSGNGVDIVAKNSETGAMKKIEVKSTQQEKLWANGQKKEISLKGDQKKMGGEEYTKDRLNRAENKEDGYTDGVSSKEAKAANKALREAEKNGRPIDVEKYDVYVDKDGNLLDIEKRDWLKPKP
ncbi:DUF4280 domain-containing protein [Pedobacter sp. PAMC26386]|nr:DUF4280 domain-containing protein [Pedobacter sp. PAMC26386]